MNIKEIKGQAKGMINGNKWNIFKPAFVLAGISIIIALIVGIFAGAVDGDIELATSLIDLVLGIALIPVTVGLYAYYLKLVRGQEFSLNDLKAYYPDFLKILLLEVLVGVFTFLWSLLLVIPGIIAAISYSLVYYICVDYPQLEAVDTISKSKQMMKGYKMDYFIFKLSFIGWLFLVPFTFGLLLIWLIPYMTIADCLFYEKVKELNENK